MKPITPSQAQSKSGSHIPDKVIEVINGLIILNLRDGSSCFTQEQAIVSILRALGTESADNASMRATIFEKKWLDFESLYRKVGWTVVYDRPGYNETYPANWTFTIK